MWALKKGRVHMLRDAVPLMSLLCPCRFWIHFIHLAHLESLCSVQRPPEGSLIHPVRTLVHESYFCFLFHRKRIMQFCFTGKTLTQPEILYLKKSEYFQVQDCPLPIILVLQSLSTLFSFSFAMNYIPHV